MDDGGAGRRRALSADHLDAALTYVVDDDGDIAAGAVEMGLDHLEGEGGGDRGIEGIAALLQGRHADCRRDPVGRGDDAEGALDLGARGEGIGIDVAHEGTPPLHEGGTRGRGRSWYIPAPPPVQAREPCAQGRGTALKPQVI